MTTFRVSFDEYTVSGTVGTLPLAFGALVERAQLHDDLGAHGSEGTVLVVDVTRNSDRWPVLVSSQRFLPGPEAAFYPAVLVVPEHQVVFIGAGTRLLAYSLASIQRLWVDECDMGFWGWARHGDFVVMSAELELAVWDIRARKLWTTFVEPPWSYGIQSGIVELDVMGARSRFPLLTGPNL